MEELTSEEIEMILADVLLGGEQRVTGEEADKFRSELMSDMEEIRAEGYAVEIPFEIPDASEELGKLAKGEQ